MAFILFVSEGLSFGDGDDLPGAPYYEVECYGGDDFCYPVGARLNLLSRFGGLGLGSLVAAYGPGNSVAGDYWARRRAFLV